ncbi:Pimeloyl-ACP methyl ester carboxylesterase [Pseudonocardia ammonioxydans]|uniref:Pimeloyl-ACP methyl ester carboxylesterase n=1 Tax=Pseudonocardia ammonioxydans TaxID=260086 RepID=A0A1I5HXG9_PSUAM|nr:alpha/beta hydrolase [Pseudonocardia ammonioxydans]SFO53002.1 Pimeloyl-ACP methyl ester carboxylesterase [Pseudonocardia ammonioxydans]
MRRHQGTGTGRLGRSLRYGAAGLGGLVLLTGAFVGANLALLADDVPVGHWRSEAARAEYERLYARAMELLPPPADTADVRTGFGTVRTYTFEPAVTDPSYAGRAPLLLLPGFGGPAQTWYASVEELATERRVIVIDTLGMPGASVQDRPITSSREQAAWLHDVVTGLGLDRVHLVGFSFGGLNAVHYARYHPDRVAGLCLLDPAYVFAPVRPAFLVGGFAAMLPLVPDAYARWYTRWISGGSDAAATSPLAALLDHGRRHYATVLPVPEQLTDRELATITTPTWAVLAGRSVVHDPAAALAAAAAMPDLTIRVEPGASHALHIEHRATLNREILEFTAAQEAAAPHP